MESKYGTSVMKEDECLLFVETAIGNGSDVQEALDDMRMIDTMLLAERNYLLSVGYVRRTRAGYLRKGTLLSDVLDNVINARVKGIKM